MDFSEIAMLLLESFTETRIVRVYEKNGNEFQGLVMDINIKPQRAGRESDCFEIKIETGEKYLLYVRNIIKVEKDIDENSLSQIINETQYCKAVYGTHTDEWWIYHDVKECYIELPLCVVDRIKGMREMESQEDIINEMISENPEWLYDEEFYFHKSWFEI